jgi:hypothetical protein
MTFAATVSLLLELGKKPMQNGSPAVDIGAYHVSGDGCPTNTKGPVAMTGPLKSV